MKYEGEIHFYRNILKNMGIPCRLIAENDNVPDPDMGLRRLTAQDTKQERPYVRLDTYCEDAKIYRLTDIFGCSYLFWRMPEARASSFILVGPYILNADAKSKWMARFDRLAFPENLQKSILDIYANIPVVQDEIFLFTLTTTLGQQIWGGMDAFSLQDIQENMPFGWYYEKDGGLEDGHVGPDTEERMDSYMNAKLLEERYARENSLMQAITAGQTQKAELLLNTFRNMQIEKNAPLSLRRVKNYAIVSNTLFRKAAEAGAVHPFHIDDLSSQFARQIEEAPSVEAVNRLLGKMVHKYCLLVKNHSMKGYSLLVSKVLTRIDSDLTADLSLKAHADFLEVNASYLSALFKKETGTSLTEYVNRKRVEYGIFLLNSSGMQIQTIALHCGIPDVNYFTKIFKKYVKMTPMEYRRNLFPYTMDALQESVNS